MGDDRNVYQDALQKDVFREFLKKAASIADETESVAIFFYLIVMGRVGLRIGELLHFHEDWYDAERKVIEIPEHDNCNCAECERYAKKYCEDNEDAVYDEVIDDYWCPKNGGRTVVLPTEQAVDAVERFIEVVDYESRSRATVARRLKLVATWVEDAHPDDVYPHMMRATAATHLAWSGFPAPALMVQFGWERRQTADRYEKKTAAMVRRAFNKLFNEDPEAGFLDLFESDPPTYEEMRPDNPAKLHQVESWSVDYDPEQHPRYRDDEEMLQETLDDTEDAQKAALDPITAIIKDRLARERELYVDAIQDKPRKRVGMAAGALVLNAIAGGFSWGMSLARFYRESPAATVAAFGIVAVPALAHLTWLVHDEFGPSNPEDADIQSNIDRAIVGIHSLLDPICTPLMERKPDWI